MYSLTRFDCIRLGKIDSHFIIKGMCTISRVSVLFQGCVYYFKGVCTSRKSVSSRWGRVYHLGAHEQVRGVYYSRGEGYHPGGVHSLVRTCIPH